MSGPGRLFCSYGGVERVPLDEGLLAQALIQRRLYEYDIVMALKALSCNFICSLRLLRLRACRKPFRPVAVARMPCVRAFRLRLLCACATTAHGYGGSRLRFLSLARSCKDRRLFATQIRQPSRARCFAIEKQWNTLFYRSSGWCGILCAAPPLVLLPHEGWCWKQRSGRNRSGEALALAFASGFQPISVLIQSQESRGNSNRKNDPFAQRPHHAPTFPPTPLIPAF
ncbi:hypothetical protein [Paenibacillus peoriae]|uniref:hypothetical protein n=1 Tax=Paenibacillus peoriae TaxID=59893 RepID=UPI0011B0856B|nr:hypothetical protein [Paenibacillus peoriae]